MLRIFVFGTILILGSTATSLAQPTALSYQGFVRDGANAANGNYDFEFALFDSLSGGNQIGSTISRGGVVVSNGSFAVTLDFGIQFPGNERFIEIRMRVTGGGPFITLSPRQAVTSSPYSIRSLSADNAVNATNAANATNATTAVIAENAVNATNATNATTAANALQLGGIPASQFVLTADPRLSDSRDPLPGSNNYIQNTTTPNTSNFNIVGSGTVSNTLTAGNAVNAGTEYRIGGSRVIGVTGNLNLFLGVDAGAANTGTSNTFVGRFAGTSNTTANGNSFFGALAGRDTSTGVNNAFFGASAGLQNTSGQANAFFGNNSGGSNTTGIGNTFLGRLGGAVNTTGNFNTTVGFATDFLSPDLSNATAIGARAAVGQSNSLVLGSINGVNGSTVDTNVGIGTTAPTQKLHVVGNGLITGDLFVGGTFSATLPSGSASYIQNTTSPQATSNFNISGNGTAGGTLTGNVINSVTDYQIGGVSIIRSPGSSNLFVGANTGTANTSVRNSFFGERAGQFNTGGFDNAFFGTNAGSANTTGGNNSFFGSSSGRDNTTGAQNAFFGYQTGLVNTTGLRNSFFGFRAGFSNSIANDNAFFGDAAGFENTTGGQNTFLGSFAGFNNLSGAENVFVGKSAGQANTTAGDNTFVGFNSGSANVTGSDNAFVGHSSGAANTSASFNSFFGASAGLRTTTGVRNAFIGTDSGLNNTIGTDNTFIGVSAGDTNTSGSNNTAVGRSSDFGSSGLTFATAIGAGAVVSTSNTVVLGRAADSVVASGKLQVNTLGAAGATPLCRNAANEISSCSSSLRYKANIFPFDSGGSFINKLHPISFDWRDGGMKDVGFVAEEIAKLDPRFVTYNDKGEVEGVKYDRLSVAFVNAFKEQQLIIELQQKRNDELRDQLERQKAKIDDLRSEINELKALVCAERPTVSTCRENK